MSPGHAIETVRLARRFGRRLVLRDVTTAVPSGSVTAILGQNGAGKSTLLRALVGFLAPSAGEVRVLGLDPRRRGAEIRRRVGFVPERLRVPAWMRVRDSLRFLEPFYPTWSRDEASRLLDLFSLDPRARIHRLSKGERTKHALLTALAHAPELLLLDEPFSGLDPAARADVLSAVLDHLREDGRTVVIASHSLPDVERVADRIVVIDEGRVALSGDLEDIRERTVRLAVTLAVGEERWTPPGRPLVEHGDDDLVLTYLDWRDEYEIALERDPGVIVVKRLHRDLDQVFLAAVRREEASCVVSLL